ncbi:SGNH/GDSL hydrolase family protein [Ekhidna sp.]|uniref:SGNH/GDSL hydrolase family protein n=1 Tax=Ekhidna sp. TaxID=2608089 RepID=UPI003CCBC32A
MSNEGFVHLALGDSYTIGEAVNVDERWPVQLAHRLRQDSIKIDPVIVATTGWTTDELMSGIVKADVEGTYDFVSLLIGVNNQYRGYPIDQYEREFKELLDQAIKFAGGNPYHVMVVSIPDYGVTTFAQKKMLDPDKIASELDNYNAIAEKISKLRDVKFIDITPISRKAKDDTSLIASDGLHPSGEMYKMWVDHMYDHVFNNLSSR